MSERLTLVDLCRAWADASKHPVCVCSTCLGGRERIRAHIAALEAELAETKERLLESQAQHALNAEADAGRDDYLASVEAERDAMRAAWQAIVEDAYMYSSEWLIPEVAIDAALFRKMEEAVAQAGEKPDTKRPGMTAAEVAAALQDCRDDDRVEHGIARLREHIAAVEASERRLLAACESALPLLHGLCDRDGLWSLSYSSGLQAYHALRDAIAAAEGAADVP